MRARIFQVSHEDKNPEGDNKLFIKIWCLDENTKPVLVRIENYYTSCYVKLPKKNNYNKENINILAEKIKEKTKVKDLYKVEFVRKKTVYYYQNTTSSFMKLYFGSIYGMRKYTEVLSNPINIDGKNLHLKVMEKEIDPTLKLFVETDLQFTDWIDFEGTEIPIDSEKRISKDGTPGKEIREFIVSWLNIKKSPVEQIEKIFLKPRVMAYDLEVYSHNKKAFPKALNDTDCIFNISVNISDDINSSAVKKYSLLYGQAEAPEGVDLRCFSKEEDLLEAFQNLIEETDPDILVGYNTFGFDNEYFATRCSYYGKDLNNFSREKFGKVEYKSDKWSSSGCGQVETYVYKIQGRISIDMLPIIKRDFRFERYTLDFVCKSLINETKHDVTALEMFEAFEKNQAAILSQDEKILKKAIKKMKRVVLYCTQDSDLVLKLMRKTQTLIGLFEMSNIVGVGIQQLFTRGQQVRTFSLIYRNFYHKNFVVDKREAEYVPFPGAFVNDVIPGVHDGVAGLDFSSLYPSIIMAYNLCPTTMISNIDLDTIDPEYIISETVDYSLEDKPIKSVIDEDFIFNEEISKDEDRVCDVDLIGVEEEKPKSRKKEVVYCNYHFELNWVKKELHPGIFPMVMNNLISERRRVQGEIKKIYAEIKEIDNLDLPQDVKKEKKENLEILVVVKDKQQLALKITANSCYGFLGAQKAGMLPMFEIALLICWFGQKSIKKAEKFICNTHSNIKVVGGDTDSIYSFLEGTPIPEAYQLYKELSVNVSKIFDDPMKMELEKLTRMLYVTKKRYAYYTYKENGEFYMKNGRPDLGAKGLILVRRDTCHWQKEAYEEVIRCALDGKKFIECFKVICDSILNLISGNVDLIEQLSSTKNYSGSYKSTTCPMAVFGNKMLREQKPLQPGSRIRFLVIKKPNEDKKIKMGEKMMLVEEFDTKKDQIDIVYYIDRLLKKPIDQIIKICYPQVKREDLFYQVKNKKPVYLDSPVAMLISIIKDILPSGKNLYLEFYKKCKEIHQILSQENL